MSRGLETRGLDEAHGQGDGDVEAAVVIAGAGPAGIATAVALARRRAELGANDRVLCFDKARFPRDKPCGGGLTGHAGRALDELGLQVRVPAVACSRGRIVYGAEQRVVSLDRPVEVIRRLEFDADLVRQARAQGVEVIEGEAISEYQVDAARRVVSLTTSRNRRLRTRVLVAADGAGSRIRKQLLGAHPSLPTRPLRLFQIEIPAPSSFLSASLSGEMIYDFSPMSSGLRGYVWLFPVQGGRLNVGAMHAPTSRLGSLEILELLGKTLERHGVRLPASPARGWPAWPYAAGAPLAGAHVLCVGDAAGIDALTGEGISVGLEHAPLAAEEIVAALKSQDFSFSGYAGAVRRATVGRELRLDGRLARLLYGPGAFRFWLSLVMFDSRVRELYAARVCGSQVLADRTRGLFFALGRHVLAAPSRLRRMAT